jgi:hypothetical protein
MVSEQSGVPCRNVANHQWAQVYLCCEHFDSFVLSMLDIIEAVNERHHADLVAEFERRGGKQTRIRTDCDPPKT